MALHTTPLASLTASDLEALVADQVAEGREIEFKKEVGGGDEAKREFLADSSSFANAVGGDLLLGVREENGIAAELVGIPQDKADAEILRLENMIRDGISPRIAGVETRAVPIEGTKRVVLVMRIPRSYAAPHMVTFKNLSRFYTRNSAGKQQLDVGEIRGAFAASDSARTGLQNFRIDRLGRIRADETPVPLLRNGKTVLHLIPLTATDPTVQIDPASIQSNAPGLRPLFASGWNRRINFDGVLVFSSLRDGYTGSYAQVFRSGAVEAVDARMLRGDGDERVRGIPSTALEVTLIEALDGYFELLSTLSVSPPFLLGLSLLGVRGQQMAVDPRRGFAPDVTIDRDDLIVPELLVEDPAVGAATILKPAFDAIWQAAGWNGSINYDESGAWGS